MAQQKNFWDAVYDGFSSMPIRGPLDQLYTGIYELVNGKPDSAKNQAYEQLQQFQQTKPGGYSSPYSGQISSLTNQLNNRVFDYNYNQDPDYQYYQSLYKQQAQRAGEHAQASAAALGGGYGSSWATTAGTDAYNAQMDGLGDVINGLYSRALGEYNDETTRLQNNLNSLYSAEQSAQNQYASQMSNWYGQQSYYQDQYDEAVRQEEQQNQFWGDIGSTILNVGVSLLPYVLGALL